MADARFVQVPGSTRQAVPGVTSAGAVDASAQLEITLVLRRRAALPRHLVEGPETVSSSELADRYGADPEDLRLAQRVLTDHGLRIVSADQASRLVIVAGPVGTLSEVFGAELTQVTSTHPVSGAVVSYRHRQGDLRIPVELADVVTAVLGLDNRPQARARFRYAAADASVSYPTPRLAEAYRFPPGTDGSGQTVAIIELGGGFGQDDLTTYFTGLKLTPPKVTAVGVGGGDNQPGSDPNGADGEVLLDIEVVGALAPGADQVVYFAPNTDQGFLAAISTAIHAQPAPAALSISWGASEDAWSAQARTSFDAALADAAAMGVTVTAAAGDNGSADGAGDGTAHTDFPAASPHVLACGGTRLQLDSAGAVQSETVWNDGAGAGSTGGGVSATFDVPTWQQQAGVPDRSGGAVGRGVPDVSGNADPATGYQVLVDGKQLVIGGTSAVAPLWAALVARLAQQTGRRFGLLQPALYAGAAAGRAAPGFRDIVSGANGDYRAGPGWDACTGLGVPDGTALAALLQSP